MLGRQMHACPVINVLSLHPFQAAGRRVVLLAVRERQRYRAAGTVATRSDTPQAQAPTYMTFCELCSEHVSA